MKAGYAKKVTTNNSKLTQLINNYQIGTFATTINGKTIEIIGHWGDRCIIGSDRNIYNVVSDFNFKFN